MRLAKVVHEQARELAQVVRGRDRGVISVVKDVVRAWIRDAYIAGYEDGVADTRAALGEDRPDTEKKIAEAARDRVAYERSQRDLVDDGENDDVGREEMADD